MYSWDPLQWFNHGTLSEAIIIPLKALDFSAQAVTYLAVARYAENEPELQIAARDVGRHAVHSCISGSVLMSEVNPIRNIIHSQAQVAHLAMILCLFLACKKPGGQ